MKFKRTLIALAILFPLAIAGFFYGKYVIEHQNDPKEVAPEYGISPCTGASIPVVDITPCVIDPHEIPESGRGFFFRYPENSGVTQSSLNVSTVERGFPLDSSNPTDVLGPFYLITFYYNDHVNLDSFNMMFSNGKSDTLAGKSVVKSTEANFPNPEYPYATGYYFINNGYSTIIVVAGYDSAMLKKAEGIFKEGFRFEDTKLSTSFNIDFHFGILAKNELNMFNGTYTKDMVMDPSVTIPMVLTSEEIAGIRKLFDSLSLFEEKARGENYTFVTPCESYDLIVDEDGTSRHLDWDCDQYGSNPDLETLAGYIRPIIESKDAYKALPIPRGGYM